MEFIYSFISDGMDKRPAYGFSQRLRAAVEKPNCNPSPLDYLPQTSSISKSKGFSFGLRPRTNYVSDEYYPSPIDYLPKDSSISKTKGFTFGHRPRTNYAKNRDFPSPAQYYVTEEIAVPRPRNLTGYTYGMKTWYNYSSPRKDYGREESERNNTMTPTSSHLIKKVKNRPGYKFGTEKRSRAFKPSNWNPGPGEYNVAKSDFMKADSYYNNKGFLFGLRFPTLIS
ncbi:unnamed protein product [Chironomus riparius]|uniref:Uncharacterized protein n=1 Tax=Chironomus riparius TaxID=315576 RepID=A0A9N9WMJ0_9DIPT|nr:unnamed protein product [Chironomus riparius]